VDRSVTGALVEPEPSVGIPPGATLSPVRSHATRECVMSHINESRHMRKSYITYE